MIIVGCKLELTEGEEQGDHDQPFDIENEPHSFVFASKNWMTTEDRLLLLIHGSGVVRAGQWARRYDSGILSECPVLCSSLCLINFLAW